MSITATRAALVAADWPADVAAYERPPAAPRSGDTFAFWAAALEAERGAYGRVFEHVWTVHVVCPADPVAADTWVEEHLDALVDAIAPVLAITSIAPGRVPAGKSTAEYNALIITGRTE